MFLRLESFQNLCWFVFEFITVFKICVGKLLLWVGLFPKLVLSRFLQSIVVFNMCVGKLVWATVVLDIYLTTCNTCIATLAWQRPELLSRGFVASCAAAWGGCVASCAAARVLRRGISGVVKSKSLVDVSRCGGLVQV